MKVFVTGSAGRIGSHIIPHLLARGHTVTGLVRSEASASFIKTFGPGVTPLFGDMSNKELMISTAKSHDAILHCAMEHNKPMPEASAQERQVVQMFGDALQGSNKPFLMSSGTAFLKPGEDEFAKVDAEKMYRAGTDVIVREEFTKKGVRGISVRLAMNTHDMDKMHPFLGLLLKASDTLGYVPYYGENAWSACPSEDAGLLYVLAMESAEPGAAVHALQETVKVKDIAEALAKRTGKKAGEVEKEKLGELGFVGNLLQWDATGMSSEWTRKTFGWEPKGQRLLEEFAEAPEEYFTGEINYRR
ncbi:hypothetical protein IAR55_006715 [Kwoniella newhampshirensis]|uniref:NAD(P)-binding domain-containing protein n=1 Tax=Kwoniella newhampshirensis TaxID=1651941 RepID=A0AAW0YTI5_9TREE